MDRAYRRAPIAYQSVRGGCASDVELFLRLQSVLSARPRMEKNVKSNQRTHDRYSENGI